MVRRYPTARSFARLPLGPLDAIAPQLLDRFASSISSCIVLAHKCAIAWSFSHQVLPRIHIRHPSSCRCRNNQWTDSLHLNFYGITVVVRSCATAELFVCRSASGTHIFLVTGTQHPLKRFEPSQVLWICLGPEMCNGNVICLSGNFRRTL